MSNGLPRIWVEASKSEKNKGRVACYDTDDAHPGGLLDISPCSESGTGYEPREVAATPYVRTCVRHGRLTEVPEPSVAEKKIIALAVEKKVPLDVARGMIKPATRATKAKTGS